MDIYFSDQLAKLEDAATALGGAKVKLLEHASQTHHGISEVWRVSITADDVQHWTVMLVCDECQSFKMRAFATTLAVR